VGCGDVVGELLLDLDEGGLEGTQSARTILIMKNAEIFGGGIFF
jgi:hypothetical protein